MTWWVIRLGVRPVQRMTATAGAIAAGDLSQRVPEGAPGTEAGDLGVALNGMLGRIEEAFDQRTASEARLRQFVADASHELRTPVTTIRGYAELYRTGALASAAELDEAMRRTEQEAVRMGTLVDDLLHLARLDQGRPLERGARRPRARWPRTPCATPRPSPPTATITSTAPTARSSCRATRPASARSWPTSSATRSCTRRARRSTCGVRTRGRRRRLEVADEGPGMAAADAARAFERFYRADASRQRHRGGSGLGLVDRRGHGPGPRRPHVDHHRARRRAPPSGSSCRSRPGRSRRPTAVSSVTLVARRPRRSRAMPTRALSRRVSAGVLRRGGSSPRRSR